MCLFFGLVSNQIARNRLTFFGRPKFAHKNRRYSSVHKNKEKRGDRDKRSHKIGKFGALWFDRNKKRWTALITTDTDTQHTKALSMLARVLSHTQTHTRAYASARTAHRFLRLARVFRAQRHVSTAHATRRTLALMLTNALWPMVELLNPCSVSLANY